MNADIRDLPAMLQQTLRTGIILRRRRSPRQQGNPSMRWAVPSLKRRTTAMRSQHPPARRSRNGTETWWPPRSTSGTRTIPVRFAVSLRTCAHTSKRVAAARSAMRRVSPVASETARSAPGPRMIALHVAADIAALPVVVDRTTEAADHRLDDAAGVALQIGAQPRNHRRVVERAVVRTREAQQ